MALQLQTAYNAFSRYKKDLSDVSTDLFLDWCNYIHWFILRELMAQEPEKQIVSTTINVTPSVSAYLLPADFANIQPTGTGFYELVNNKPSGNKLTLTQYSSTDTGYYISRDYVNFTPVPTTAKTYNLRYIPEPPTFTALTDYFTTDKTSTGEETIPTQYLQFIVQALDVQYGMWDEEPMAEGLADQRFTRVLSELLNRIKKNPNVYGLNPLSSNF